MKIRYVAFAAALLIGSPASADVLTSGTATRVGEPLEDDSVDGRSQIKLAGKVSVNPASLTTCTFTLVNPPIEMFFDGDIFNPLPAKGKPTEVTFQTPGSGRPSLKAVFKKKAGELKFTIAIDRAATIAPAGINTEPCQNGDEAVLETSFTLQCSGIPLTSFLQPNTWRVNLNCEPGDDYPNLRVIQ